MLDVACLQDVRSAAAAAGTQQHDVTEKAAEQKAKLQDRETASQLSQESKAREQPLRDNGEPHHSHSLEAGPQHQQPAKHSRDLSFQEWSPEYNGHAPVGRDAPASQHSGEV